MHIFCDDFVFKSILFSKKLKKNLNKPEKIATFGHSVQNLRFFNLLSGNNLALKFVQDSHVTLLSQFKTLLCPSPGARKITL